ncbi:hypothetical protein VOLCADRAFT_101403 [Volvox carteri f. nagariensis]|uniref:Uncharacterized protein n=1 Tax=Volvox carteri f. nagariensis TaxID=3068 RepID=D8UMK0_VOLCA|nr:uncharacterized protein VOLCADRAFT_101403 [Volvox carteri f. nagariensis]EFJ39049.1 hypothetical protein VOLCADRAFT_101403 [Volvox carteri f. nagariensis]|eukprot:XP_002959885.1 hypothetical protein VOLCADRAFT_101403 [Volvox carteri f. nagariensis]
MRPATAAASATSTAAGNLPLYTSEPEPPPHQQQCHCLATLATPSTPTAAAAAAADTASCSAPTPKGSKAEGGNHPCWSAWEQKAFLTVNRNWQAVSDFFQAVVCGRASLSSLGLRVRLRVGGGGWGVLGFVAVVVEVEVVVEPDKFDLEAAMAAPRQPRNHDGGDDDGGDDACPNLDLDPGGSRVAEKAGRRATEGEEADASGGGGGGVRQRPGGGFQRQRQRHTYKVTVSYFGPAFEGWAFQPGRRTLQGALEASHTVQYSGSTM